MRNLSKKQKLLLILLITVAINLVFYVVALPQTFKPENDKYARDFSAYYIGIWRLIHNPTQVYYGGSLASDYQITPKVQSYKYSPSFLILLAPFSALNYQTALEVFDAIQIGLIPALAFFVYYLVKDKSLRVGGVAAIIVMIDPLPSLLMNSSGIKFNVSSFAPSYYLAYALANAHVLQVVLLVGAIYFGYVKKPWFSALLFALGAFDPRAAIVAFPLLVWYNRQKIAQFFVGAVAFFAAMNLPFFFYYGVGSSFLKTDFDGRIVSQLYQYDWIPLYAMLALTVAEIITVAHDRRKLAGV